MKLLRITTNYNSYLKQFYLQCPELKKADYAIQHQSLMADSFAWADFWTYAMKPLGYQGIDHIANAEFLQKAWAKENGIQFQETSWLEEILLAQIKAASPNILFVDDYSTFTSGFIKEVRQECSSIKLVLGWCGAPYDDISIFGSYDITLSNIPGFVEKFRQQGYQAEYMKHAFDPRILSKIDSNQTKNVNFSFIGSIIKGSGYHLEREQLIQSLIQRTDLEIWSDLSSSHPEKIKSLPLRKILYDFVQIGRNSPILLPIISRIPKIRNFLNIKTRPSLEDYVDLMIVTKSHPPGLWTIHVSAIGQF